MNGIIKLLLISISKLPLGVLYKISDVLYYLQTYLIKYRYKVVVQNITNSFPDKTAKEIDAIVKEHNKNFCDFAVETLKSLTITQTQLDKRAKYINKHITNDLFAKNDNVMLLCGHMYNWEWIKVIARDIPTPNIFAIYHVPSSALTNDLIKKSRERFGGETIPKQNTRQILREVYKDGKTFLLIVADQSPFRTDIKYDITFMNQASPVYQGFDKIARIGKMGVIYLKVVRKGRGKFVYEPIEIVPDGESFAENEVIHKFFALLEENIREDPANYMWTHKRWKYKKGIDY